MIKPCDICLDETCKGKHSCKCKACSKVSECSRYLHPTIRITTKCTQTCSHCCFSCSPKKSDFMPVETATKVAKFLKNNEINVITLMGGEFFCHPDWAIIIDEILSGNEVKHVRLVTNGDWAAKDPYKTLDALTPYKDILKISISEDQWHTNENVRAATNACEKKGFFWNTPTKEEQSSDSLVPVGRNEFHYSFMATFSCYCHDPRHMYSFLIDEKGDIFKCAMGVWCYSNVSEYTEGDFAKIFKSYNRDFYKAFVPNCKTCYRVYRSTLSKDTTEEIICADSK